MSWETVLVDLDDYYPGSRKKRQVPEVEESSKPADTKPEWDKPKYYTVGRGEYEFFTIGSLAAALDKKAVTIRLWESLGYIPVPGMWTPSDYERGKHRLYTRPQIEGIVRIAQEEGILGQLRPRIGETRFQERVLDLFISLAKLPVNGAVPREEMAA